MPEFWVDADAYITPSNKYYALDLAPSYWKFLLDQAKKGSISSPMRVYEEVTRNGKDPIQQWLRKNRTSPLFTPESKGVAERYAEIAEYVMGNSRFSPQQKLRFLEGADGWLVAYACEHGGRVITLEVPAPFGEKVKIPDVCDAFKVKCATPWDMLRSLGFRA